jgi:hypothetical protein
VLPELLIVVLDREKEWKEVGQIQAQLAQEVKENGVVDIERSHLSLIRMGAGASS